MNHFYLSRKEEIVLTTIELINELGIKAVSIKEIAKQEGVTEASLYKHFRSKEEIIISVIEYYERYDEYIYATLRIDGLSGKEIIDSYFNIYSEYYSNYRAITSLIGTCEVWKYDEKFGEKVKRIIHRQNNFLQNVIETGQKKGEFRESLNAENVTYLMIGGFEKVIEMWRMREYNFDLKEKVQDMVTEMILVCEREKNEQENIL